MQKAVGQSINRLEGRAKVTGAAKYAAEYDLPDLLHGYVLSSTITKGKITDIDDRAALAIPGVKAVLTHKNRPKLPWFDMKYADMDAPPGTVFKPLYDEEIKFNGQPIALVLADDFETARYASTLVKVSYKDEAFSACMHESLGKARDAKKGLATAMKPPPPKPVGDFEKAFAAAPVKAHSTYKHSTEHHNPIELFATTVQFESKDKLTIYDKTQGTVNVQMFVANVFGLKYKNVRVLAPYVGGAFGSGLRPQYQLFLAVLAARHLQRNVRVVLDRKQMFPFGHRPPNIQELRFCTDAEGKVTGLGHSCFSETSTYEDYTEAIAPWSHKLYPAENTLFEHKLVPVDVCTPIDMRAPGGCSALHAIESMMDELSYKLNMDPLELRLKNYAEKDPASGKPYTSKALRQCYELAAEKFGWSKRNPVPGSMVNGNKLIGYGMATGIWDAYQFPSRIEIILQADGRAIVHSAVTDIGTGTLTVMTQVAADELGLQIEDVSFEYGDSDKPFSMFQGGSAAAASTGVGIHMAAQAMKEKLLKIAKSIKDSQFKQLSEKDVVLSNGSLQQRTDRSKSVTFSALIAANGGKPVRTKRMGRPHMLKLKKYALTTHSASFVEVEVDKQLKTITVKRAVTAVAAGKILNPKTAGSQILGSMVWGISKALHEETLLDERFGRYINANLGEYHVAVNADTPEMEVIFADEKDDVINEIGVKGVGEIGIVGMPAAIANAVYHATGKRINNLPIHFDELL